MKHDTIYKLTSNFEDFAHKTQEGIEFWLARDLQHLLGYGKWDNFKNVISKAKTACEISEQEIFNHFADVGKTINMPKGATKEIDDIMLTRYACYLIAQNGDPRKQEIAFAQTYFAVQTRKAKDFATEINIFNAKDKKMKTERQISGEHITNNKTVRNTLISRGITPENLPPEEDVKKIERKLKSDEKKSLKNNDKFDNQGEN